MHSKVLDLFHRWSVGKIEVQCRLTLFQKCRLIGEFSQKYISKIQFGEIVFLWFTVGISSSWSFLRSVSSFPNVEEDLVNIPLLPPSVCNATWVHCGACADITSHTIANRKAGVFALWQFRRIDPMHFETQTGFLLHFDAKERTMMWRRACEKRFMRRLGCWQP